MKDSDLRALFCRFVAGRKPGWLGAEFNIYEWEKYVRANHNRSISGTEARDMLRPLEESGVIKYTEMLHWKYKQPKHDAGQWDIPPKKRNMD